MTLKGKVEMVRLQPAGRLDWQGGQQLQEQVGAIAVAHCQGWIIDMSQIEFVDSSGLVALIQVLQLAKAARLRLAICHLRPSIRLIFDISKLDRAFSIFDTYEAAVTYCRPPEAAKKNVTFSLGVA